MKILITGSNGMLGRALVAGLSKHTVISANRDLFDVTDSMAVDKNISTLRPNIIIHSAAMTAVDRCETETELAWKANAIGSSNVAIAAYRYGARLISISTDYVFGGTGDRAFHEWDETDPRTVYGRTKLAGELAVRQHCPDHVILRVAWLYGAGGPSFLHTMDKVLSQSGDPAKIVVDQIGNPTSTTEVVHLINHLIDTPIVGTVHGTCQGEASWYELASAYAKLKQLPRAIIPCTSSEYLRPAPRPLNSRLEKRALRLHGIDLPVHWEKALSSFVKDYPHG